MATMGGGFVHSLAQAFYHADSFNFHRLKETFPDYWAQYSAMAAKWEEQQAEEAARQKKMF